MNSVPEEDCIIIERNEIEFWAISKGVGNLNIYKWDIDSNTFIQCNIKPSH